LSVEVAELLAIECFDVTPPGASFCFRGPRFCFIYDEIAQTPKSKENRW